MKKDIHLDFLTIAVTMAFVTLLATPCQVVAAGPGTTNNGIPTVYGTGITSTGGRPALGEVVKPFGGEIGMYGGNPTPGTPMPQQQQIEKQENTAQRPNLVCPKCGAVFDSVNSNGNQYCTKDGSLLKKQIVKAAPKP